MIVIFLHVGKKKKEITSNVSFWLVVVAHHQAAIDLSAMIRKALGLTDSLTSQSRTK